MSAPARSIDTRNPALPGKGARTRKAEVAATRKVYMARPTRFERATPAFGGQYSNPAELRARMCVILNVFGGPRPMRAADTGYNSRFFSRAPARGFPRKTCP